MPVGTSLDEKKTPEDKEEEPVEGGNGYGMKGFAVLYGLWLVLSFVLDAVQLATTRVCTYAPGREWGPEDRWYVMDINDGDDGSSKSDYWRNRIDDDKWFADDLEKVDANGNKVDASTRKTYWDEAGSNTRLTQIPQGIFLILVGIVMLCANIAHLAGFSDSPKISNILYLVSVTETMDQYFILNLTCSSMIDGASFFVSAVGLMVSSFILYFKCSLLIKREKEENIVATGNCEPYISLPSSQRIYLIVGLGAWGAGLVVAVYAINVYPSDTLEFIMGVIGIGFSIVVAVCGYFFGEVVAQFILQMFKTASRVKQIKKAGGQVEMFMGNL